MKIKTLPGYPTYEFKITWFDMLLAIEFVIACVVVVYMAYELA